jgi:ATP citrate (pro-S)-lyase
LHVSLGEAVKKHPDVDVVVNFASSRGVYSSTMECLQYESIKAAEGERQAREILWKAKDKGVLIIGPATVVGIKPGCFRIGNSGGCVSSFMLNSR